MIPIELVNKILVYVGELNNNVVITQYHPITNKEYYPINFTNDLLWRIKATLFMKKIYPVYDGDFSNESTNKRLYKFGIPHYEKKIRLTSN